MKIIITEEQKKKLFTPIINERQVYPYELNPSYSDPDKREIVYEFKNRDNHQFEVVFYNLGDNNWEREYRTLNKGLGVLNTSDVYNIMETVTKITLDFIRGYEPNIITIFHIKTNKEKKGGEDNKISKRALLNKKYLQPAISQLDNYYYKLLGSTSYISKI